MMTTSKNVILYGAGGQNIGQAILDALTEDGSFNISVLARKSSKATYPGHVKVLQVSDDLLHEELVAALKGQDAIVSAVGGMAGVASQYKIIDAAIEAKVKRFFPSEYGFDNGDVKAQELSPIFKQKGEVEQYLRTKIAEHPDFSWTSVATGIWTEWALPLNFLGIDSNSHTVTYWGGGNHAFSSSTLAYSGTSVVQALKHPEVTENKRLFLEAFAAPQREIVAELERQQGVTYTVLEPTDGAKALADAHKQWKASGETDLAALYTTVSAGILMKGFGADFRAAGKGPLLEDLVTMPKVTLQDVVRTVIKANDA